MNLRDRKAIVTGAGSGIGRAVALGFARAGAAVACISRDMENLRETAAQIEAAGERSLALPADVCDLAALQAQCLVAERAFGGIDLLFAAAGVTTEHATVQRMDPQAFRRVLEVNLVGAFNTAKAVIPPMQRSGGGQMIFVGSGAGHRASATRAGYATAKAGLRMLVRVLAQELMDEGIVVNEMVPGPVRTAFIAGREAQIHQAVGPSEWFKTADDVVPMALFMASQQRPGPTGQTFSLARREI